MKKFALLASLAALAVSTPNVEAGLFGNDCCYSDSCCDGKFIVGAEWLYWKVEADNLDAAFVAFSETEEVEVAPNFNNTFTDGFHNKIEPSFKWDSGFRVFAGYEFCDCWELDVVYSYLPSHAKTGLYEALVGESEKDRSGIIYNPIEFPVLLGGLENAYNEYYAKWDFNANCIDIDLTKTICFGECLRLRPHAGFRAFWFDQKYKLFSFSDNNGALGAPETLEETHMKQTFRGYGVEGGLWGEYDVGCGLSIVGHFGGAILYTKSTVKQNLDGLRSRVAEDPVTYDYATFKDNYTDKIGVPMLDTFLGLQYADCVCDMMVFGRIGWESHVAFDANRLPSNHGNITAQGLTLGLGVGF